VTPFFFLLPPLFLLFFSRSGSSVIYIYIYIVVVVVCV
jgi:hypothetical protein